MKRTRNLISSAEIKEEAVEEEKINQEKGEETRSKRVRKPIEILSIEPIIKKKQLIEGTGKALKDIPAIAKNIKTYPANSYHYYLESFHNVLYGFAGKNTNRRQHILNFNGFSQDIDRNKKYQQLLTNTKYTHDRCFLIRTFLEILNLSSIGTKEEMINRLLDFLYNPK